MKKADNTYSCLWSFLSDDGDDNDIWFLKVFHSIIYLKSNYKFLQIYEESANILLQSEPVIPAGYGKESISSDPVLPTGKFCTLKYICLKTSFNDFWLMWMHFLISTPLFSISCVLIILRNCQTCLCTWDVVAHPFLLVVFLYSCYGN